MPIDIEPFQSRRADAVASLILGIQRDEFGIAITRADQPDLSDVPGFYRHGAGDFWVAQDGDVVVGTIALKDIGGRQAALRKMFVAASHRGRELQVAVRLLAALIEQARRHGIVDVFLGTTEAFRAAHRFYEKNGFVPVDAGDLPASFPRMGLDTRFYRRRL